MKDTKLHPREDGSYELACGCISEFVNGKYILIQCEDCEKELEDSLVQPIYFKKTKMRENREI